MKDSQRYLFSGSADSGLIWFCETEDDEPGLVVLTMKVFNEERERRFNNIPLHEALALVTAQVFEDLRDDELDGSYFEIRADEHGYVERKEKFSIAPDERSEHIEAELRTYGNTLIGHTRRLDATSIDLDKLENRHDDLEARVEALERRR